MSQIYLRCERGELMNNKLFHHAIDGRLAVVENLSDQAIKASIEELRRDDDLTTALREMVQDGVSLDALSASSGLSVSAIQARVNRPLALKDDYDYLAGIR